MLEYTFLFGLLSLFFLFLYFKLSNGQQEQENNTEVPTPFIDRLNRFFVFCFAILSFIIAFNFGMLGEPVTTYQQTNNVTNFTTFIIITNGVGANNVTSQTVPVISNFTKTTTVAYTNSQFYYINQLFALIQNIALMFGIIYLTTLVVRAFTAWKDKRQRRQEGDYGE